MITKPELEDIIRTTSSSIDYEEIEMVADAILRKLAESTASTPELEYFWYDNDEFLCPKCGSKVKWRPLLETDYIEDIEIKCVSCTYRVRRDGCDYHELDGSDS